MYRTHTKKLGWDKRLADSFQEAVKKAFPEAMITGYEDLIPLMTNDEKDRHVVAAAVREKLDMIITFNLRDFSDEHLKKWNVKAVHPQDYLLILYSMNPAVLMSKLSRIAQKRNEDLETIVMNFGQSLPLFAERLLEDMGR